MSESSIKSLAPLVNDFNDSLLRSLVQYYSTWRRQAYIIPCRMQLGHIFIIFSL